MTTLITLLYLIAGLLAPQECPTDQHWAWTPDAHIWACTAP